MCYIRVSVILQQKTCCTRSQIWKKAWIRLKQFIFTRYYTRVYMKHQYLFNACKFQLLVLCREQISMLLSERSSQLRAGDINITIDECKYKYLYVKDQNLNCREKYEHWYRRGHGLKSWSSLNSCLSCTYRCDGHYFINASSSLAILNSCYFKLFSASAESERGIRP